VEGLARRRVPGGPEAPGLFEHEYGVPVKPGEWQALREHVVRCLRNFHRLPLLADIKRTPVERWILLEDIGSFPWEGTRIVTAPDFGYWTRDDRLQLVDWKTGGGGAGASLQLGGYALYSLEVLGVDLSRVDLARGEPARGQGHRASLGRAEPRPRPGLHPAVRCAR
jgi:hypothetical protein